MSSNNYLLSLGYEIGNMPQAQVMHDGVYVESIPNGMLQHGHPVNNPNGTIITIQTSNEMVNNQSSRVVTGPNHNMLQSQSDQQNPRS